MADVAVVEPNRSWTRAEIDAAAGRLADRLGPLDGARVALLCDPGHDFLVALRGIWAAGGVAVPLHVAHPRPELLAAVADAGATGVVCSPGHEATAGALGSDRRVLVVARTDDPAVAVTATGVGPFDPDRAALMVFTSGTTGRPKGVVHTHGSLAAQVQALHQAWGWTADDRTLLVLPLNHVHGIMAVVLCAFEAGATCETPGPFEARATWERLASGELTVFMAVPTIYARLVAAWEAADDPTRRRWSAGAARARLMVSGSAALPVTVLARWQELTGQVLLERYGMTEFGMALSNTLTRRVPGHVGEPLPGIEVRLVDEQGRAVADGASGELLVRGPAVFREYWNRPAETAAAFVDGWFRTGDVAVHEPDGYRLLGRSSVDILKTGGEKVSALEIEECYRTHPAVADCAVVGVPDDEWGQRVAMAVVARPSPPPVDPIGPADPAEAADRALDPAALRAWGKARLAGPKVPTRFLLVEELPRNTLGKVTKPAVTALFAPAPG